MNKNEKVQQSEGAWFSSPDIIKRGKVLKPIRNCPLPS